MAASTIAPTAIAMPPSDMMFELMPIARMGMNEMRIAIGIVRIGITALGMCHRKIRITSADDDQLLGQRVLQIVDRAEDQVRAIVRGDDLDARAAGPARSP